MPSNRPASGTVSRWEPMTSGGDFRSPRRPRTLPAASRRTPSPASSIQRATRSPARASAGVAKRRVSRSGSSLIDPERVGAGENVARRTMACRRARSASDDQPPPAMRTLYANGWIVTMDDAGTEHPHGWVLVDGAVIVAVGAGEEPDEHNRGLPPDRLRRRGDHARPRQHPPSPVPDPDPRAGPGGGSLHVAARALPDLGADRRRGRVRGRADGARRARPLGLLDGLRPPLRLPAWPSGDRRGGGAGGARARRAARRLARLDGSRRLGRWASARRARRGSRLGARRDRAAPRRAPRGRAREPASRSPSLRALRSPSRGG